MPLPERVPLPSNSNMTEKVTGWGIKFSDEKDGYATMTLPEGWTFNDISWREDLPEWVIVDTNNMMRASVRGAWKGAYDNQLDFYVLDGTKPYVPRQEPAEPSETQDMMLKTAVAYVDVVAKKQQVVIMLAFVPVAVPCTDKHCIERDQQRSRLFVRR